MPEQGMKKTAAVERNYRAEQSCPQVIHNTPSVRGSNVMYSLEDVKKKIIKG
jgi:hypothetical protein